MHLIQCTSFHKVYLDNKKNGKFGVYINTVCVRIIVKKNNENIFSTVHFHDIKAIKKHKKLYF